MRAGTLWLVGCALGLGLACGDDRDTADEGPVTASSFGDDGTSSMGQDDSGPGDDGSGPGDDGDDGTVYDVGGDDGGNVGPCGGGAPEASMIWIANTDENTVSKFDTETGEELGRYQTSPSNGSPSRTSVGRSGKVAVANRNGGVVMIHGITDECPDENGMPGVQTSTGTDDVLAWGTDECVQWFVPLPGDNRPVAWTAGEVVDPDADCDVVDEDVWTASGDGTPTVYLLDGADGSEVGSVQMPELESTFTYYYGGAVDHEQDFWVSQWGDGTLMHVDHDDFGYEFFPQPVRGYGMTLTSDGYVWICGPDGLGRFDPDSKSWQTTSAGAGEWGGCMGDGNGILYRANLTQVLGVDTETLQLVKTLEFPVIDDDSPGGIWGVAVDFQGKVWGVPRSDGGLAYAVDPETGEHVLTVEGLVSPYTYSDMTGVALAGVVPPVG